MSQRSAHLRRIPRPPGRGLQRSLEADRLLSLTELVNQLMRISDPAQLIDALTLGLQTTLAVDTAVVWLHNPTSHRYVLTCVAKDGALFSQEDRDMLSALQVRSGEALVGRVVSDSVGRMLPDAEAYRAMFGALGRRRDALYTRLRMLLPEEFSVLALPLYSSDSGRPLGVVELLCADQQLRSSDLQWLRRYTQQLGILLNLVRMQVDARKQRRRLAALDSVVTAISTASDLTDLLQVTLLVMIEVVAASGGAIYLVAPGQNDGMLAVQHQVPPDELALFNSSQAAMVLEDVIYYGQPSLRPALSASDQVFNGDVIGRAAVPLLAGGTIVGVLLLYGPLETLTVNLDWPALVSVGSQIAIAIANTRLYEESQRERQRLSTVIASIADGVAICDETGQLILANEAAAALLGLASLPALSRDNQARTLKGQVVEPEQMPLARALAGEVFRDYQLVLRGANDQDLVLSFSGAPLRGSTLGVSESETPNGAVVVFRDITAQRRLDEAKDEFLAIAAHELRSPLAAIKGYSDLLLRRELRNGTEGRELRGFQVLNQQVNVLVQLVDNLLDISRIDAGRFILQAESVDIKALAESVVTQVGSSATQHTVHLELPSAPALVWGDALRLRQVVTNLLTNAVRYSPVNTSVWVRVQLDEREVQVLFDDEGPGIPPSQRERLFERYYRVPGIKRTGSSTEGLGLGLYLCREIIALHEGRIWVDAAPTGGARFIIALPMHMPAEEPAQRDAIDAALDAMLARVATPSTSEEAEP